MFKHILLSFVAIALLCSQANSACSGDFSTHTGPATYYGSYTGGGMCSLDPTPYAGTNGIYSTVAIASNYYSDSIACGMCLNVTSTQVGSPFFGSRLVYVNNKCPDCDKDLLDFGMNGDEKYPVSWTPVPCRVDDKTIEYKYQGSHAYYLKIQPRNTRYAVASVELLQGSTYKVLPRTPDYFFATPGSSVTFPLSFPLSLRITSTTGAVVIDSVAADFSGSNIIEKVYFGANKVQFPLCGASGTAATTASSTTTTTKSTSTTTTGKSTTTTTGKSTTTSTTTTGKSTTSSSTTTAKATSTTTTGSSSTTGSASFKYIFNDGFENSFQDWSWGAISNTQDTPAKSGSVSYSSILESWGAAYFACKGCIDTSKHSSIEFFIRSSVAIQSQFSFALVQNDEEKNGKKISNYLAVNPSTVNAWTKVTVPLGSGSGFSGVYDGLWIQETSNTGSTQPKLYIDEVKLFAK